MSDYGHQKSRKRAEPRKSIVVPLNPNEKIELRFYPENSSDFKSWFGTTEELKNVIKTGKR